MLKWEYNHGIIFKSSIEFPIYRDVAQFGSASGLGPEGRRFESCHPDQSRIKREFSSAGRASALQAGCHRFEPCNSHQYAGVAQLVEQLICNQQVAGSSPITSSKTGQASVLTYGRVPEWPKGADCKSVASSFDGSNPSSPTIIG